MPSSPLRSAIRARPARGLLRWGVVVLLFALVAAACSSGSSASSSTTTSVAAEASTSTTAPVAAAPALSLLHAVGGADPGLFDAEGRQVLLRGVNLNSLGDYYQEDPARPQVVPVTTTDWAQMASLGMSSVRLIVSWSFLEPTRGAFDQAYVARIKAAVAQAKAHGIYVILDMHQDAWGKYIATPKGTVCPKGTEDNSGWDGAPKWATITDGASTCRAPGNRESAPAVQHAFNNFYANTEGIQDEFVKTWARLAGAFAADPTVAGYDLINEPNVSGPVATIGPQYFAMLAHLITAIRAAEAKAPGGQKHVVFFEPLLDFPLGGMTPPPGFTTDTDIAFAPHNYWEAITQGIFTVAQGIAVDGSASKAWNVPYWIGEYGWWDTSATTVTHLHEFAAAQDAAFGSSDWWQWKQACGDPHGLSNREATPPSSVVQLNTLGCPGDKDEGFTKPLAAMVSRAYPRAAPGHLTKLVSDYDARTLTVSGIATGTAAGTELVVWVPKTTGPGSQPPLVGGANIEHQQIQPVTGGWLVTTTVGCGPYTLTVDVTGNTVHTQQACPKT